MKSILLLIVFVIISMVTTSCTHVSNKRMIDPSVQGLENTRNPSFDRMENIRW